MVKARMKKVRAGDPSTPSEPADDESAWTPKMVKFTAAIDAGEFKMKTPMGQDFQRAKAQDEDLRK